MLADLAEYHVGDVIDVVELWADVMVAFGHAERMLTEPTITVHDDGHRVLEIHVIDSVALVDR